MIGNIPLQRPDYATTFDITPLLDKEITALSAGQWQRVAITKILNTNRKVVALDEPDAPLDEHWSKCLEAAILDEISIGKIVIVTLHRPEIRKYWKFQCLNLTPMDAS